MDAEHTRFKNGVSWARGRRTGQERVPKGPHLSLDCFASKTRWETNVEHCRDLTEPCDGGTDACYIVFYCVLACPKWSIMKCMLSDSITSISQRREAVVPQESLQSRQSESLSQGPVEIYAC